MEVVVTCGNPQRRDNGKTYHYRNLYKYIKSEKEQFQILVSDLSNDVEKPIRITNRYIKIVAAEIERKHPEIKLWNVNTDEAELYNEIVDSFMCF